MYEHSLRPALPGFALICSRSQLAARIPDGVYWDRREWPAYLAEGEKRARTNNDPVLKDIIASARAGYAQDGERGLLKNHFATEEKYHAKGRLPAMKIAMESAEMGFTEQAFQSLEEARADHDPEVSPANLIAHSKVNWTSLKEEPRFRALLKTVDSPQALGQTPPSATPALADASLRAVPNPH